MRSQYGLQQILGWEIQSNGTSGRLGLCHHSSLSKTTASYHATKSSGDRFSFGLVNWWNEPHSNLNPCTKQLDWPQDQRRFKNLMGIGTEAFRAFLSFLFSTEILTLWVIRFLSFTSQFWPPLWLRLTMWCNSNQSYQRVGTKFPMAFSSACSYKWSWTKLNWYFT